MQKDELSSHQRRFLRAHDVDPSYYSSNTWFNWNEELEHKAGDLLRQAQFLSSRKLDGKEFRGPSELTHALLRTPFVCERTSFRFERQIRICESYFRSGGFEDFSERIVISTLPGSETNGICVQSDGETTSLFVFEGIFYFLPGLIRQLFSILEKPDRNSFQSWFSDIVGTSFQDHTLLEVMKEMLRLDKSACEDWLPEPVHPHADMKEDRTMRESEVEFFRCQGAYTFICAHELSHVARRHLDHLGVVTEIAHVYMKNLIDAYEYGGSGCSEMSLEKAMQQARSAAVHHPLELEADFDALSALSWISDEDSLKDEQVEALADGVVATLVIIEFIHFARYAKQTNAAVALEVMQMSWAKRNLLSQSEHPCPLSRIPYALELYDHRHRISARFLDALNESLAKSQKIMTIITPMLCEELSKFDMILDCHAHYASALSDTFSGFTAMGHLPLKYETDWYA